MKYTRFDTRIEQKCRNHIEIIIEIRTDSKSNNAMISYLAEANSIPFDLILYRYSTQRLTKPHE